MPREATQREQHRHSRSGSSQSGGERTRGMGRVAREWRRRHACGLSSWRRLCNFLLLLTCEELSSAGLALSGAACYPQRELACGRLKD